MSSCAEIVPGGELTIDHQPKAGVSPRAELVPSRRTDLSVGFE